MRAVGIVGLVLWYGWLLFGTQLNELTSVRLCLNYDHCGDLKLWGTLMAIPAVLLLLKSMLSLRA
jgi:hypothetical protein